jgi:hypothetical protein
MCTDNYADIANLVLDVVFTAVEVKEIHDDRKVAKQEVQTLVNKAHKAENEAIYERQEGIEEARRKKLKSILSMGEQQTKIAANNISLSSDMAINLVDDEKLNGELEALNTLKSSEHKAENYMSQAKEYYDNASLKAFNYNTNSTNKVINLATFGSYRLGTSINTLVQNSRKKNNNGTI